MVFKLTDEQIKQIEQLTGLENYNSNNNAKGLTITENNPKHNVYGFYGYRPDISLYIYQNGFIGYRNGSGLYQTNHEDYSSWTPIPFKLLTALVKILGVEDVK